MRGKYVWALLKFLGGRGRHHHALVQNVVAARGGESHVNILFRQENRHALPGHVLDYLHILEMNGDSYRLNQSQKRRKPPKT